MSKPETIKIDEVEYVRKDSISNNAVYQDYVIVRTYTAGVFFGHLASRNGQEVVLKDARRLWMWDGAASLSQLAVDGTVNPSGCKFPTAVPEITLLQAIEISCALGNHALTTRALSFGNILCGPCMTLIKAALERSRGENGSDHFPLLGGLNGLRTSLWF